ncbi:archaemetzincin family Zn-dependent metalloprotease [Nitratifractor salsuginis]|uniref:Peptidase zinc-dependent n=1 Tax=Nitratifractor salsuginis (strain DSM 16511 / JCM 12458 / E9I37-1) TaxID=749222 RepID=E6X2M2_NITSE|nr:archaemetzincin family Zn-dependent metalloprotease [Nitratifractor salsuginis]ADV46088.1 peptidase zinc-dependent [Nitratifractor salsuginis DSM 16511]
MCRIGLVLYRSEPPFWLDFLSEKLEEIFTLPVILSDPSRPIPDFAYNPQHRQYLASALMSDLCRVPRERGDILLGITDEDLYEEGLNFVFGLATPVYRCALVATPRLHNTFYGLAEDEELFLRRLLTEAVHELGHTLGLEHCPNPHCVMHFSNTLADTDRKGYRFCPRCRAKVDAVLKGCR